MAIKFDVTFNETSKAKAFEQRVRSLVKSRTPVASGRLLRANRISRSTSTVTILNNEGHAAPVHEGSRPHKIVPRKARALRFTLGGKTIYAKSVWHPGTTANPYIEASIFEALENVGEKHARIRKEIRI